MGVAGLPRGDEDLFGRLLEAGGPSGTEGPATSLLREAWAEFADEVGSDPLGNLWAIRRGADPAGTAVALAAHVDVIGLVVTRLLPGGFLSFAPVGGIDRRALPGREVLVAGRRSVPAVVATIPPHLTSSEDRRRIPPMERLVLDTGLSEGDLAAAVRPGDRAVVAAPPQALLGERVAAAGLDNRAGVAALYAALVALHGVALPCDLVCVANVQEEVGLRGIAPVARRLRPAAAVVVDVGFGSQAGAPEHLTFDLGKGPVLAVGPALHPVVTDRLRRVAADAEIQMPVEAVAGGSGTDAWALQVASGGVPTGLLSIPLRSMHTTAEVVDRRDVRRTGRVLADFVRTADTAWIAGLAPRLHGGDAVRGDR